MKAQFVKKENGLFGETIKFTYKGIPFVSDNDGKAVFVIKKSERSNNSYYLHMLPFLGYETKDVDDMADRFFNYTKGDETYMQQKIESFIDWLTDKHPFCPFKDISELNAVKPTSIVAVLCHNGHTWSKPTRITNEDVEGLKEELTCGYNAAYGENCKACDVTFKFRLYE